MAENEDVVLEDNTQEVLEAMRTALGRALEKCGLTGEKYAKLLTPVDTGNLRNSLTHIVQESEKAVYIGTDSEYAPYVEFGTGKYVSGGRPTPWAYQDANGNWHRTSGQEPQPYLKPAVAEHKKEYQQIFKDEYSK